MEVLQQQVLMEVMEVVEVPEKIQVKTQLLQQEQQLNLLNQEIQVLMDSEILEDKVDTFPQAFHMVAEAAEELELEDIQQQ